jgi:hypothetical protein
MLHISLDCAGLVLRGVCCGLCNMTANPVDKKDHESESIPKTDCARIPRHGRYAEKHAYACKLIKCSMHTCITTELAAWPHEWPPRESISPPARACSSRHSRPLPLLLCHHRQLNCMFVASGGCAMASDISNVTKYIHTKAPGVQLADHVPFLDRYVQRQKTCYSTEPE